MTIIKNHILKHTYNDSIVLMQFTVELEIMPGIEKAAIMMGTPAVLQTLKEASLLVHDEKSISSDDMVIAVAGKTEQEVQSAIQAITAKLLTNDILFGAAESSSRLDTDEFEELILWKDAPPEARVALISVPGQYAAAEAWQALKSGRHVMLFSNNVSIDDEILLKKAGKERNLLVMGPDCGTAIINGIPLGFANRIKRGNIGIVAAAGSGLQELTCLIDRMDCGVSHAIGTGGRDLSLKVNGITTRMGLELLKIDPETKIIGILSKPPDPKIAAEILDAANETGKPVVACLLGLVPEEKTADRVHFVSTIEEMAIKVVELSKDGSCEAASAIHPDRAAQTLEFNSNGYIRGFFSGGTLAYEAYLLMQKRLGDVYSNTPLDPKFKISIDDLEKPCHMLFDLGTEEFTTGRPHPMIDGRWRSELIARAAENKDTAVILFDLILGLGADPNPAGSIIESIQAAKKKVNPEGRNINFIASIVGTEPDPQHYSKQFAMLQAAGVIIAETNAEAARMAIRMMTEEN
jgi:FdrA protein